MAVSIGVGVGQDNPVIQRADAETLQRATAQLPGIAVTRRRVACELVTPATEGYIK